MRGSEVHTYKRFLLREIWFRFLCLVVSRSLVLIDRLWNVDFCLILIGVQFGRDGANVQDWLLEAADTYIGR